VSTIKVQNIQHTNGTTGMTIDSGGRILTSARPAFFAFQATNDWIDNVTGGTTIVLNTTKHNVGSHYSTSTGKFTAPVAGVYAFSFSFYVKNASGTAKFYASLNDTAIHYDNTGYQLVVALVQDADTNDETVGTSWTYYMSANDTMSIVSGDSGTDYFGSMSYFSGFLLG
jgi:hypothetical protein